MDLDDEPNLCIRFPLRDRDARYCLSFDASLAAEGVEVLLTRYRSPQANGHLERLIGGVRREVLDRVLILGRRHLSKVLGEYVAHHYSHRPHRGLGLHRPHDVRGPMRGPGPARPEAIRRREGPALWPLDRSLKMLRERCSFELHAVVVDAGESPLEDDEFEG